MDLYFHTFRFSFVFMIKTCTRVIIGSQSIRTQVNSYSFWSIRTQNFGQLVLIWSIRTHVWSVRTHFGQFVLILVNSYSNSNEYELTKMSTIDQKLILVMVLLNSYSFQYGNLVSIWSISLANSKFVVQIHFRHKMLSQY